MHCQYYIFILSILSNLNVLEKLLLHMIPKNMLTLNRNLMQMYLFQAKKKLYVDKVIFTNDKFPIFIYANRLLKTKEILNENQLSILPFKNLEQDLNDSF